MSQLAYALLVRPDNTFTVLDWPAAGHLPLLHRAIECDRVDVVDITPDLAMWVDDEGMIKADPIPNMTATAAVLAYAGRTSQLYFGNAVFTGGTDDEGNTLGLTQDQVLSLTIPLLTALEAPSVPRQRTGE